jgi:hypothetical protein
MRQDMPERTTRDYTVPAVGPRVQAALSAALAEEDDVTMGGNSNDGWSDTKKYRSSNDGMILLFFLLFTNMFLYFILIYFLIYIYIYFILFLINIFNSNRYARE